MRVKVGDAKKIMAVIKEQDFEREFIDQQARGDV